MDCFRKQNERSRAPIRGSTIWLGIVKIICHAERGSQVERDLMILERHIQPRAAVTWGQRVGCSIARRLGARGWGATWFKFVPAACFLRLARRLEKKRQRRCLRRGSFAMHFASYLAKAVRRNGRR